MDVYQCPDCELKFSTASELESHIRLDHPNFQIGDRSLDEVLHDAHRRRHRRSPHPHSEE